MRSTLLGLLLVTAARADENPVHPVSYSTPSPDGNWLFVMLPPPTTDPKTDPDGKQFLKDLRAKYAKSGLYPNDGSTAPAWTVDWYSYLVYPANDGEHLVRVDGESTTLESFVGGRRLPQADADEQTDAPALTFTKRGVPGKTYTVRQLAGDPEALPHSIRHVLWHAGGTLTVDGTRFVLQTQDSRQLVFDLATGDVLVNKEAGLGNLKIWVVRGLLAVVFGVVIAYALRHLIWGRHETAPA